MRNSFRRLNPFRRTQFLYSVTKGWGRRKRAAALVAVLPFLFLLTVWLEGGALVAPVHSKIGTPPEDLPGESLFLHSESRAELATWYLPAAGAKATLVLFHGIRADRRALLENARLFHQAGYTIVMIDFQAHGESTGNLITLGYLESLDARAAVDFAKKKDPTNRIGVVGVSLGGASILLASPLQIDAAVLESVYPTISEAVFNRVSARLGPLANILTPILLVQLPLRLGISAEQLRPIDYLPRIGCPVLLAAGDADQSTTIAESAQMFDVANEPKKFVVFHGAGHVGLLHFDPLKYREEVLPFLNFFLQPTESK